MNYDKPYIPPKYAVPLDITKIDVEKEGDVYHWCNYFGCTEEALRAAIKAVGPTPKKVKTRLREMDELQGPNTAPEETKK